VTGLAGAPTEFFDEETKQGFLRHWELADESEYLSTLLLKKTSPNGVFGFKAHWHQYRAAFGEATISPEIPNLEFIFIRRRNQIRQAVSYWRAIQTNQWAVTHRSTNQSPRYDFDEIAKLLERIRREEKAWLDFFTANSIEPLELFYEEFANELPATIHACLNRIGFELPSDWVMPELTLKKQADEISDRWVTRFVGEQ